MPPESRPAPPRGAELLHRWFVRYNPLYFASALCMLAGVFLLANELPPDAFGSKLGVAASTEAYELLLIGGAALLLRAGLKRPAAILGIVAFIFILDVAFNGERLMSFMGLMSLQPGMRARRAVPASLVFALLGPLKLWLLARVFRLRSARGPLSVVGSVLLALPLLPYGIELESTLVSVRNSIYLGLSWLGAPLLGWAFTQGARRWSSAWTADGPDPWMTRRIAASLPFVVGGIFAAHVLAWRSLSDLSLAPAQAAPYFLAAAVALAARTRPKAAEAIAWSGTGLALWTAAFPQESIGLAPLAIVALAGGAALIVLMESAGLRLFLPAAVCVFGGAYLIAAKLSSPLPAPGPIWPAAMALALLIGAVRQRDFRCLFVSAIAAGATLVAFRAAPAFAAYGGQLTGLWLAVASWMLFPDLRRWVPFASTAAVLALGGWMAWHDLPGITASYGSCTLGAIGAGVFLRRPEFQGAGLASGSLLAALRHDVWIPGSAMGAGVALVASGFLLLAGGVAINLLLAKRHPSSGIARVPADPAP